MHGPQRAIFTSLAAGATTPGIVVSYRGKNATFNAGVQVSIDSGVTLPSSTIEVTMDDPADFAKLRGTTPSWDADAKWAPIIPLTAVSDSFAATITSNCYGIRLLNASSSNVTSGALTVLQD